MGVRIYWGDDYFYAVAVDGEYEYMTYEEYLLLKHRTPGYAVVFDKPPVIRGGEVLDFQQKLVHVESVERVNGELFLIGLADGKAIVTDGGMFTYVDREVFDVVLKNFDAARLKFVDPGVLWGSSYVLSDGGRFIIVYENVYLEVDEKSGRFTHSIEISSFLRVIDFRTRPTVESIYEVRDGEMVYRGKAYVEEVLTAKNIKPERRVFQAGGIGGTLVVRVKGGKVELVKKGTFVPEPNLPLKAVPLVPPWREGVLYRSFVVDSVKAVVEYGGRIYYVDAPLNAYLYGSTKFLVETFGRPLPIRREGGELVVDYGPRRPAERGVVEKKYRVLGFEARDGGYALVVGSGEREVVCPLMRVDLAKDERVYSLSFCSYKYLLGGDEERPTVSFDVIHYDGDIVPVGDESGEYSADRFMGMELVEVGGFRVPGEKSVIDFLERYGELVRGIVYYPLPYGYGVGFDFGDFIVVWDKDKGWIMLFRDIPLFAWLDDDSRGVALFGDAADLGGNYGFYNCDYFEVVVDGRGKVRVEPVKLRMKEEARVELYYPFTRPEYVYRDCGVYLAVRGRPVVLFFWLCLPEGYAAVRVRKMGWNMGLDVVHVESGRSFLILRGDDEGFMVLDNDGGVIFRCPDNLCVSSLLEVYAHYGDAAPMLL